MNIAPVRAAESCRIPTVRASLVLGTTQTLDLVSGAVVRLLGADPRRATVTIGCIPLSGTGVFFGRTQAEAMEEATALNRPVVLDGICPRLTHNGQIWCANHGTGTEQVAFFTELWAD